MKNLRLLKGTGILLSFMVLFSCASKKDIVYLQEVSEPQKSEQALTYEPQLKSDDLLMISVTAENPELAVPYNLTVPSVTTGGVVQGTDPRITYLIDKEGNVDFPVLGKIKLAGLTRIEAVKKMQTVLKDYIKNPIVNLRILNYKVSVLGEVARPGVQTIQTERITLLDALSAAGDLTIYGKRDRVTVIREVNGVKTIVKVDLTKRDFIDSPYYYLSQNDIVYVEPNKTRVDSSVVGPNIAVFVSIISLAITVATLITK